MKSFDTFHEKSDASNNLFDCLKFDMKPSKTPSIDFFSDKNLFLSPKLAFKDIQNLTENTDRDLFTAPQKRLSLDPKRPDTLVPQEPCSMPQSKSLEKSSEGPFSFHLKNEEFQKSLQKKTSLKKGPKENQDLKKHPNETSENLLKNAENFLRIPVTPKQEEKKKPSFRSFSSKKELSEKPPKKDQSEKSVVVNKEIKQRSENIQPKPYERHSPVLGGREAKTSLNLRPGNKEKVLFDFSLESELKKFNSINETFEEISKAHHLDMDLMIKKKNCRTLDREEILDRTIELMKIYDNFLDTQLKILLSNTNFSRKVTEALIEHRGLSS